MHVAAAAENIQFDIVIMFRNKYDAALRRISYATIENEWNTLMAKILSLK